MKEKMAPVTLEPPCGVKIGSGHLINASRQVDVGTWKIEHGRVNKIVPLVPDLLAGSGTHPGAAEKSLLTCWPPPRLSGWGALWPGLSPALPPPTGLRPAAGLGELRRRGLLLPLLV